MPVHDWRKVDAGTFHAFHNAWNTHLMGRLNGGILPKGYYALAEQYVRGRVPDVLTFQLPEQGPTALLSPPRGIEELPWRTLRPGFIIDWSPMKMPHIALATRTLTIRDK